MGRFQKRKIKAPSIDHIQKIIQDRLVSSLLDSQVCTTTIESAKTVTRQPKTCVWCDSQCLEESEGGVVCTDCAVLQPHQQILVRYNGFVDSNAPAWRRHNPGYSITIRHIYSRKVYFGELLRNVRGEKETGLTPEYIESIRAHTVDITPETWREGRGEVLIPILKKLKLTRFKSCRMSLAYTLSGRQVKACPLLGSDVDKLLELFVQVELVYKRIVARVAPTRKIFMNYPYLFGCLCLLIGKPEYYADVQFPANEKSTAVNGRIWRAVCVENKWPFQSLRF